MNLSLLSNSDTLESQHLVAGGSRVTLSGKHENDVLWFRLSLKSHRKLIKMCCSFFFLKFILSAFSLALSEQCQKIPQSVVLTEILDGHSDIPNLK